MEARKVKHTLVGISINHPKLVVLVSVLITLFFGWQMPKIHIDTDPENMLLENEEVRLFHHGVMEAFGIHDWIVLGVVRDEGLFNPVSLARIAEITRRGSEIDGVIDYDILAPTEVDDIFTTDEGILRVETLMEEPPETQEGADRVLRQILANPILRGKLASDDGTTSAIFFPIENKEIAHRVSLELGRIVDEVGGDETYHLAGIPVAESTFGAEMFKQMAISAPMAFLLIFLLMLFFFRKALVVLGPMIVAMMSVIWSMGLLIGLGFTVHIMSSMIPIFLIPIAVLNSIHVLSEFHDRYHQTRDMRRTVVDTMDELFVPMAFTSITTVVGFASLMFTPIPPVQVFGAFVAFGIFVAWLLSILFVPAYVMLIPKKTFETFGGAEDGGSMMNATMRFIRTTSLRHRVPIVAGGVLVLALSVWGLTRIVVSDNPVNWFKADHPLRIADREMNKHLAGTYIAYLVLSVPEEGGLKDPAVMKYAEALQEHLLEHPNVGATTGVTDVIKKMGEELKGDPAQGVIPDSRDEIAQYLFLYEISGGDPADLFKFITPEADRMNIWVQMKEGENRAVSSVVESARKYMEENPPPAGVTAGWAGLPYINVVWQEKMVKGMSKALIGSFVVVLLMMIGLFRSVRLGLISMIPLTVTIAMVYGAIGFGGKPYDMPIAILSSLTLGLSIDFAIHFLQRTREIYRETGDFPLAMERLFQTPARAITRNILVIAVGFVPMFFANLVPYITVGAFFFAIMVISGFTTLFTFPAILSLMNPAFLAGGKGARQ